MFFEKKVFHKWAKWNKLVIEVVLLFPYSNKKIVFRKIKLIFEPKNLLSKWNNCNFWKFFMLQFCKILKFHLITLDKNTPVKQLSRNSTTKSALVSNTDSSPIFERNHLFLLTVHFVIVSSTDIESWHLKNG